MKSHLTRRIPLAVVAALAVVALALAFSGGASHGEARSLSDDPTLLSHTVSAGGSHTCGVRTGGTPACWGDDSQGQATPPAGTFTQVSAGFYHTCGVKTDSTLACWGSNNRGQATPPAGTFTQVSAGSYHNCGVRTHGTLACSGWNVDGQSTPPSSVGGIAELPDIGSTALATPESSGRYVVLLAGAALGAAVLLTAAWYARRRWLV